MGCESPFDPGVAVGRDLDDLAEPQVLDSVVRTRRRQPLLLALPVDADRFVSVVDTRGTEKRILQVDPTEPLESACRSSMLVVAVLFVEGPDLEEVARGDHQDVPVGLNSS